MINTRIQTAAFGRTDRMTLEQFLLRISFDTTCPDYINPMRWNAMITWAKKRGYIF
jgi:hypothetical protein